MFLAQAFLSVSLLVLVFVISSVPSLPVLGENLTGQPSISPQNWIDIPTFPNSPNSALLLATELNFSESNFSESNTSESNTSDLNNLNAPNNNAPNLEDAVQRECQSAYFQLRRQTGDVVTDPALRERTIEQMARRLYENAIKAQQRQDEFTALKNTRAILDCNEFNGSRVRLMLLRDLNYQQVINKLEAQLETLKTELKDELKDELKAELLQKHEHP